MTIAFLVLSLSLVSQGAAGTPATMGAAKKDAVQSIGSKEKQNYDQAERPVDLDDFSYVGDNLVSALYHELGHALIEILDLPVLGQEEDAADVLAAILVDIRQESEIALRVARNAALSIRQDANDAERSGRKWEMWDEHGPDMQRYYNLVCLIYGADPETRGDFANDMDLPDYRAELCADEYELASASWGRYLDAMAVKSARPAMVFSYKTRSDLDRKAVSVLSNEIDALNRLYGLNRPIQVSYEQCGEDASMAAYYSVGEEHITICQEYTSSLARFERRR